MPLPTALTAAAWALPAAVPVTGFSASSYAAVPCAGPLNAGGREPVDELPLVVGGLPLAVVLCDVAAPAIADAPRASAISAATPATPFLRCLTMRISPFGRPGVPGFSA